MNRAAIILTLLGVSVTLLSGCTRPGPRALLEGKALLDQGKYSEAILKLERATALLVTNAHAYNYLGLAYHNTGKSAEAFVAYQKALALKHDLIEARYNLGCLHLANGKLDNAKNEFTAYTLDRRNSADGFLRLGTVQLRLRELAGAEKSFSEALNLNRKDPEALTGLGLVRVQRGRALDAIEFFQSALKAQSNYPPALLNIAIVAQQQLHNPPLAVQYYRDYLALQPPPVNAAAISNVLRSLEPPTTPARLVPTNVPALANSPPQSAPLVPDAPRSPLASRPPVQQTSQVASATPASPRKPDSDPAVRPAKPSTPPASTTQAAKQSKAPASVPPVQPPETVKLPAEPVIKPVQDVTAAPAAAAASNTAALTPPSAAQVSTRTEPAPRRTALQKLNPLNIFSRGGNSSSSAATTELPQGSRGARYQYERISSLVPGNRREAEKALAEAYLAQRDARLADAIQGYEKATRLDPSYFRAHYNLGVVQSQAGNLPGALSAYQHSLAVQPGAVDARYNFAMVLKQSRYFVDSANELRMIVAKNPADGRAHLALGNLYAQQLGDTTRARQHYTKVLELNPATPQAGAIRQWLSENR